MHVERRLWGKERKDERGDACRDGGYSRAICISGETETMMTIAGDTHGYEGKEIRDLE